MMVRARDRNTICPDGPDAVRDAEHSATARRVERMRSVIARRQLGITVVLEDVFDPHNANAVLRSCDAVGVVDVHLVYVEQAMPRKSFGRSTSASAAKWLNVHFHDSIDDCYALLREQGFFIIATALQEGSTELYDLNLTDNVALVFGNEKSGVSRSGIEGADATVYIPMQGMVESLNISVSCAVTLYEAMRQRKAAGMYDQPQFDEADNATILEDWISR